MLGTEEDWFIAVGSAYLDGISHVKVLESERVDFLPVRQRLHGCFLRCMRNCSGERFEE